MSRDVVVSALVIALENVMMQCLLQRLMCSHAITVIQF